MALRVELTFIGSNDHPLWIGMTARVQSDPIVEHADEDDDGIPVLVTFSGERLRLSGVHVMEVS